MTASVVRVQTPHGTARAHVHKASRPRGALVLGHGAAGSVTARDLVAVADVALSAGLSVALVEQPYRVAGRRSPAPAKQLDGAWTSVVEQLRADGLAGGVPLLVGGRSSGARVACRTVVATGAHAVLCLAFPLLPPRRSTTPVSRQSELDAVAVPTLIVQGAADPFGVPSAGPTRRVALVAGNHSLTTDLEGVARAVGGWLEDVLPEA